MTQHRIPELLIFKGKLMRKACIWSSSHYLGRWQTTVPLLSCKYQNPVYLHTRISSTR